MRRRMTAGWLQLSESGVLVLVLVGMVPRYYCNSGNRANAGSDMPSDAQLRTASLWRHGCARLDTPAQVHGGLCTEALRRGRGLHCKPCASCLQQRLHCNTDRFPLLFTLPFVLGSRLRQRKERVQCKRALQRPCAGVWCLAPKKDDGDSIEKATPDKAPPLSEWIAEIEKDIGEMSPGLQRSPRGSPKGSRHEGLSRDWDKETAAAAMPTSTSFQGGAAARQGTGGQRGSSPAASPRNSYKLDARKSTWDVNKRVGEAGVADDRPAARQAGNGVRSEGSRGSRSGPLEGERKYDTGVLRDLTKFRQLEQLLDALEPFIDAPEGVMTAPQAVASMNHLKRLAVKYKSRAKSERMVDGGRNGVAARLTMSSLGRTSDSTSINDRVDRCMRSNTLVVNRGMYRLTAKHVALALNAVRDRDIASQREYKELFRAGAKRVRQLATSARHKTQNRSRAAGAARGPPLAVDAFDSQNIANIVNAFASANVRHVELFESLAKVAVQLRPLDYTPQAVAIILNAYARAGVFDRALFDFLALVALALDPSLFSAQHVANIANAFAKANVRDDTLLRYLSATAQAIPASSYSLQAVANILGAFSHFGVRDEPLYAYLSTALRNDMQDAQTSAAISQTTGGIAVQQVQAIGAAALGNIVKSLARAQYSDKTLFRSVAAAVVRLPSSSFDAQAVADIVSAWVLYYDKQGPNPLAAQERSALQSAAAPGEEEALLRHMSAVALMICIKGGQGDDSRRSEEDQSLVSSAVLMLPAFSKCLEVTGACRPYGPVRYWLNELFRQYAIRIQDQVGLDHSHAQGFRAYGTLVARVPALRAHLGCRGSSCARASCSYARSLLGVLPIPYVPTSILCVPRFLRSAQTRNSCCVRRNPTN